MYKCIIFLILLNLSAQGIEDADFSTSNGLDILENFAVNFEEPIELSQKKISLLKENFEKLKPSKVPSLSKPIIPKVIHQIWLGNNPLPKNYQYYANTWKKYHPDWDYKLWTEEEILSENFSSMDLYLLAGSYQERADIIRYEILKKYGGLYVDTDIECLANYDELNHKYDFYAGMESPVVNKFVVSIPNSLIGTIPGHPIINKTLEDLRKNWVLAEEKFEKTYSLNKNLFLRSRHFLAVQRSMYPFTQSVYSYLEKNNNSNIKSIVLPAGYNTPIYYTNNYPLKNKLRKLFSKKIKLDSEIIIKPETMSFQHYGKERNSNYHDSNFDQRLYHLSFLEKIKFKNIKENDKFYLSFKEQFNKNFPIDDINYQPNAIIPEKIYLYKNNLTSNVESEKLKSLWQKSNKFFTITIIDYEYLNNLLPLQLKKLPKEIIEIIAPFYLLNQNGGVFVHSSEKPLDLHEFNYKFALYGKFIEPNSIYEHLKIKLDFLAFKANHILICNFLKEIELLAEKGESISSAEISQFYIDSFYKYNQLEGKNVIFPSSVIEQKITHWIIK